jgi:UDP-galactopyranose mutase
MKCDYLIVGAGITGATIARILAEAGKQVLVVDKRNHIGGNCYDEYDEHGILIHKYGPHIFHTEHKEVWGFLSRFTEWRPYQHRVRARVNGKLLPFPINLDTINQLYNLTLEPNQMADYLDSVKVKIDTIANSKDSIVSRIGIDLYEKFFKNYTLKQWGVTADELHPSVCERIPVRLNRDDRYFTDRYQGMPLRGYTELFKKMLSHNNINILLKADYADVSGDIKYKELVYTGPIDEYFNYCYGKLGYRSLRFDFKNFKTASFQDCAVVNYPNGYDFTRITEYKKLTGQRLDSTTVSYEYPCNQGDPYYPVPTSENSRPYERYCEQTKKLKNVTFAGRLGAYHYMNIDTACFEGMKTARGLLNGK